MKIERDIRPVTWLRRRSSQMLAQVNETRSPIIILRHGKPRAVIQDFRTYEDSRNALSMMKELLGGKRSASGGRLIPRDKASAQVRRRSKAKRPR